jgi:hypothetical protein
MCLTPAEVHALFEADQAAVRRYAFHRAIQHADADDLVTEVLAVPWRRHDDVPTHDALPWPLPVAGNVRRPQGGLPEDDQEVLRLVALALGCPGGTVPSRRSRDGAGLRSASTRRWGRNADRARRVG